MPSALEKREMKKNRTNGSVGFIVLCFKVIKIGVFLVGVKGLKIIRYIKQVIYRLPLNLTIILNDEVGKKEGIRPLRYIKFYLIQAKVVIRILTSMSYF